MTTTYLRAPGKAMWLGEYVVLDGAPALVAAVDRHAVCREQPGAGGTRAPQLTVSTSLSDERWTILDADGQRHDPPASASFDLLRAVVDTLDAEGIPLRHDRIDLHFSSSSLSEDTKLGLGSSAAIAALAARALSGNVLTTNDAVYTIARAAHDRFQGGVGSGSDVAAACFGGLLKMQRGAPVQRLDVALPHTLVIYTGFEANTRDFVRNVQATRGRPAVDAALDAMRHAAIGGVEALESSNLAEFLHHVKEFHRGEEALTAASGVPVVTDDIRDAVRLFEHCGGAGKASGAGGGDIVIGFFATQGDRDRALDQAVAAQLDVIPLAVEARGVLERAPQT